MAVPRNRHSNARKNTKKAHSAKKKKNTTQCSNCGKMIVPHRICPYCGFYGKRMIIQKNEEKTEK